MSDDRIPPGRTEFESQRDKKSVGESASGASGTSSIPGQLSRMQRHGGNTQRSSANMNSGKDSDGQRVVPAHQDDYKARRPESANLSENQNRRAVPDEEEDEEYELPAWVRALLWILRKSIVPIIMIVMLIAGLYAGYVFLGNGSKDEVFNWDTWRHLYDLIFAES